jgi:hypothetical protein
VPVLRRSVAVVESDLRHVPSVAAMKAAYVRPGGPLYPVKRDTFKQLGGQQFFWDANDPAIQPPAIVLSGMRQAKWMVGTTRDPSWTSPLPDPITFAEMLVSDLARLAGKGIQHSTIADIEGQHAEYAHTVRVNFRALAPGRYFYWTFEPFQGGAIPEHVAEGFNTDPYSWMVPQLYFGESVPAGERPVSERAVLNDLEQTTIHDSKVKCYYDRYEAGWEGVLFDWTNIATTLP